MSLLRINYNDGNASILIERYNIFKNEDFSIYSTPLNRPIFRDSHPNELRTMHDHLQHQP